MKKISLFFGLLLALVIAGPSKAEVGVYRDGVPYGVATDFDFTGFGTTGITNDGSKFRFPLVLAGVDSGGSGSVNSSTNDITATGYSFIYKDIGTANSSGTLSNGKPGQILTIAIAVDGGATWYHLQPTTKTAFNFLEFNDAKDSATLLFVTESIGWVVIATNSVVVF